jgi:exonuclease SbcD
MTESIRVLHFADVHIGMENFGRTNPETGLSSRVHDFLDRLDEMIAYAREHEADLIIFAGDAFRTAAPNPTYQRSFARRVRELSELAPVVMLVGNHDVQPNASKASSIEIYDTLAVPNVWVADTFEVRAVATRRGRVVVGTAPYPVRARLLERASAHGKTMKEIDDHLQQVLYDTLEALAAEAHALAGGDPRLLVGHFSVAGAVWGSERSVMLGRDVQVALGSLADPRWDYVALGHIHRHQNLTQHREGVPPVVYSGSIERIDFGEQADPKGFCWVELVREDTSWAFVPLRARPMITLEADCREDHQPTVTLARLIRRQDLTGAIVRLRVQLTPETDNLLKDDQVRQAVYDAGAYYVAAVEHLLERRERIRLGISPEGLTHEELLDKYLQSRNLAPEARERLLALGKDIIDDVNRSAL